MILKSKYKRESAAHTQALRAYIAQNLILEEKDNAPAAPTGAPFAAAQALPPIAWNMAPRHEHTQAESKAMPECAAAVYERQQIGGAAKKLAPKCATEVFETQETDLDTYLKQVRDESFTQMLFRKIDEKGIKDSECYKKAGIDKRLFSKIRSNAHYKPSKSTALALIIALELPFEEAVEMLKKAGYAFSHASKADLIVEYYLKHGKYNLYVINASLLEFDQPLIGNFS